MDNELCAYCLKPRKVFFKNTPKGKQCIYCWRYENAGRASVKKTKTKKTNKLTIQEVDYKFSFYIRYIHSIRGADNRRIVKCYTCDEWMNFSEAQCGHYMPRANMYTRYMPENCRPQCKTCNEYKDGNIEEFKRRLEFDSPGITEQLELLAKQVAKLTQSDLQDIYSNIQATIMDIRAA